MTALGMAAASALAACVDIPQEQPLPSTGHVYAGALSGSDPPVPFRSCAGGGPGAGKNCGASGTEDCCASPVVPASSFLRYNSPDHPARVDAFRLDEFEITVGRMRAYLASLDGDAQGHPPAQGAGAHPRVPSSGWRPEWNTMLPQGSDDVEVLFGAGCIAGGDAAAGGAPTWRTTPSENDKKPANCASWFLLFAFCIWDGGRLPTEAEFQAAELGGDEQRANAWPDSVLGGAPLTFENGNGLVAAFLLPQGGTTGEYTVGDPSRQVDPARNIAIDGDAHIAAVGSFPAGNGRWGHADLNGNLYELVLDESRPIEGASGLPAPDTCDNCAYVNWPALDQKDPAIQPFTVDEGADPTVVADIATWPQYYVGGARIIHGGSWSHIDSITNRQDHANVVRFQYPVMRTYEAVGARCAHDL
jgi:formylglycine-generating enzyme required for sulfatase activity